MEKLRNSLDPARLHGDSSVSETALELESALNIQQNPMVLIDRDYRIVAANRAYREAYGVRREEIVGKHCHEISHHSPIPCHMRGEDCPHQAVFRTGQAHEVRHIHYDQNNHAEHVRIRGHVLHDPSGRTYLGEEIIRLPPQDDAITCNDLRMVGKSPAFLRCLHHIEMAARTDASILLFGESGVGKELAAQAIHHFSSRAAGPLITVDCATLPENLFESEIFGHERGAFTGCVGRKLGLYEQAHGGTLFLDEVGELPLGMQAKLLRVLETGSFRRLGGNDNLRADVRVVAATNRDLRAMAAQRHFREDLYYRLAAITIDLPPLRDRREDIPGIAKVLLERIGRDWSGHWTLSREAERRLCAYNFPGNVRELRNILQKAAALADGPIIEAKHLEFFHPVTPESSAMPSVPAARPRPAPGRGQCPADLLDILERFQGNRRQVAEYLGVSERSVYRWLRRLDRD
ncbi:PAS domain-containing protein [Acidithiobacillus caldus]|uniref:Sigma54 specific transcriptional regulator n=1 Tax=Acidithiobacillus caldus (strain SM-1) TaxID=990288 RepID=F9ZS89_ACICS|nr:sigma 54-interacting transcriptional regulator [Acidithiobacillus caldus]AEK59068.1 putative sigma54 specific transcriptional regulator [Acidithiobacillus caldus SM-1]AUW33461.1 PAS domain-containing protein [Acidithiobacillus caldus]MCY0873306.1 sigma 54-interacting transcriptional regulator [Acidithiobacillus caldus]QER44093.1 putative Transcriptional Regulator, Fis family [Acidithiobacillus caldus]